MGKYIPREFKMPDEKCESDTPLTDAEEQELYNRYWNELKWNPEKLNERWEILGKLLPKYIGASKIPKKVSLYFDHALNLLEEGCFLGQSLNNNFHFPLVAIPIFACYYHNCPIPENFPDDDKATPRDYKKLLSILKNDPQKFWVELLMLSLCDPNKCPPDVIEEARNLALRYRNYSSLCKPSYQTTNQNLTAFINDADLEKRLTGENDSILGMLPGYENPVMDCILIFCHRKKACTKQYQDILAFLSKQSFGVNENGQRLLRDVKSLTEQCLNAPDVSQWDKKIKPILKDLLILVKYQALTKNVSDQADKYLKDLPKTRLFIVLLGEYQRLLDKSTIILYLDNIRDSAARHQYDYLELCRSTYAHEFFHHIHFCNGYNTNPDFEKESENYSPGTIVIESLASRFEHWYDEQVLNQQAMADALKKSWKDPLNRYWEFWPYAGACLINNKEHFREIFDASLQSFDNAGQTLGID